MSSVNIFLLVFELMIPFKDGTGLPWPNEMSWMWKRSPGTSVEFGRNKRLRDMFHQKVPYFINY